jgi:hypothetical protein
MRLSLDEQEAQRRVRVACDLIRSAYRLHSLNPKETISSVQTSIAWGAEEQAEDIREDAFNAA